MTKQTPFPLHSLGLSNTTRTADSLVGLFQKGQIEVDQPYQRGSVWTVDQQQELIRSLLEGLPIGSLTLNDRMTRAWNHGDPHVFSVIDGKQRLLALTRWFSSALPVPASWFAEDDILPGASDITPDGPYLIFADLTDLTQRKIGNRFTLDVATACVDSLAAEADIFYRLNNGGTVQREETILAAAKLSGRDL